MLKWQDPPSVSTVPHPVIQPAVGFVLLSYYLLTKNPHVSEPIQFTFILFKDQLYTHTHTHTTYLYINTTYFIYICESFWEEKLYTTAKMQMIIPESFSYFQSILNIQVN